LNIFTSLIGSRLVATVSAILVIAVGCAAGVWQLDRAHQKIALASSMAAHQQLPPLVLNGHAWTLDDVNERRITVTGRYLPTETIWLDNRPRPVPADGSEAVAQSGFYVLTPLQLEGTQEVVWVNRGWAPRNNEDRTQLPPVSTPAGMVTVVGIALANPGKVFALGKNEGPITRPRIEQNMDLEKESHLHAWKQIPFIVREINRDGLDGLARGWTPPTIGVERHYAYAFQWFALAMCGFIFWLVGGLRQYRQQGGDQHE